MTELTRYAMVDDLNDRHMEAVPDGEYVLLKDLDLGISGLALMLGVELPSMSRNAIEAALENARSLLLNDILRNQPLSSAYLEPVSYRSGYEDGLAVGKASDPVLRAAAQHTAYVDLPAWWREGEEVATVPLVMLTALQASQARLRAALDKR